MDQGQLNAAVASLRRLGVPGALRAADHLELAAKDNKQRGNRWAERLCYSLREALEEIPKLFGQPPQGEPLVPVARSFLKDLGDRIDVPGDSVPQLASIRTLINDFRATVEDASAERRVRIARAMMFQARTGRTSPQVDAFAEEWAEVVREANTHLHTGGPAAQDAEALLDRGIGLLAALVVSLSARLDEMDSLASIADPSDLHVQQLVRLLADERLARYFFTQQGSAEWLEPLLAEGFFDAPMDGDWYQGSFLVRVAQDKPGLTQEIIARFTSDHHPYAPVLIADVVARLGPTTSRYLEESLESPAFGDSWSVSHALERLLETWAQDGTTDSFSRVADRALEPVERADGLGRVAGKFGAPDYKRLISRFVTDVRCDDIYSLTEVLGYKLRRAVGISRPDGVLISMTRDRVEDDRFDERDVSHALVSGLRDALRRMRTCGESIEVREAVIGALDNEVVVRIWADHLAEEEGAEVT